MDEFKKLKTANPHLFTTSNYAKIREKLSSYIIHENSANFDSAVCDICLTPDVEDLPSGEPDDLVICEICYVVVHRSCYGRDLYDELPEGDWV
jgi:hypothetical protein